VTRGVKVEIKEEPFDVNVKRFYLPVTLTATCPECGKELTKDCRSDYPSHPKFNCLEEVHFYCVTETEDNYLEHEFYVPVRFGITAEILGEPHL
jgi:hypothetical protein